MGQYDSNIAHAEKMLEEAEQKYHEAVISMADAAQGLREHVLSFYKSEIDEAKQMIETFKYANDNL